MTDYTTTLNALVRDTWVARHLMDEADSALCRVTLDETTRADVESAHCLVEAARRYLSDIERHVGVLETGRARREPIEEAAS